MQSEKVNIWDALSHGGWDEAMSLNRRGMLDSPLYNEVLRRPWVTRLITIPLDRKQILDCFRVLLTGADNMIMELYDYLDTFTPEELIDLVIEPGISSDYKILRDYFVKGLKSGKVSRERFERIISLILDIEDIKTPTIVLIDSLFVKLILEGIYSKNELLSFVPDSLEYDVKVPVRVAFGNLEEMCVGTRWYNLGLLLLTTIEVSDQRLEQLVRTYYKCGGTCELLLNNFVEDFVTEAKVYFSQHILRTIERAIIFNCDKSPVQYDTELLTRSAQGYLIGLMEGTNVEV